METLTASMVANGRGVAWWMNGEGAIDGHDDDEVMVHAFCNVFSLQCIECERIHRGQYRLTSIFEVGNHDVTSNTP